MASRATRTLLFASAAFVLSACASREYVYQPVVNTSASIAGRPASYYRIPPSDPHGDVRIATFGLADIGPADGAKDELKAIHVQMIVANNGGAVWTIDTREQRVVLPGQGESRPAYAKVDLGAGPVVAIAPGQKRTIDLFYPLPAGMQQESELPAFDTIWRVHTEGPVVVERTPFERLDVTPVYDAPPYPYSSAGYYGWGPPYYYDPWYGYGGGFAGARLAPIYVERPVVIEPHGTRPPPARRVR